ncbi:agmatinase [Peptoclostridium litorale DSM 5388]|uniref:Guanidinobutyrase Gbh n=1 Tax=Peptoclostridium litorale DSM 5388 TaxID=1121324 RepID=A0A069RBJ7_PEPLI|nr:agmatinase [Peptoclostridium litorale]KDR94426.1 guanidinobutyrase Gbh [Peptoclostridium litorale DSM 5388]SIO24096.1 agmatinase [Peptoclostridium litorale DSM 5388]
MSKENQPASALSSPRFCNTGTFMRMPRMTELEGLDFAVVGVPFDTASSYRTGSRFGPSAIRNISSLIKPNNVNLQVNVLESLKGADCGDVNVVPGWIHETFENIENELKPILDADVIPIILGGDHSISLANLRAIAKKHGPVAMVHFDSHADINDKVFGMPHNHGTPFRRAHEEGLIDPDHVIQIGMRGSLYDPDEHRVAEEELGFRLIAAHKVREMGIEGLIKEIKDRVGDKKVFLTFDIDFVDPAYCPGTGTPEVGGFTTLETLTILRELKDLNFVGCDIVEVAPQYDPSEMTAFMAANVAFEFISMLAAKKNK